MIDSDKSCIVISKDIDFAKESIIEELKGSYYKVFERDEFKVEDSKSVISEAYIAEEKTKYILLVAKTFNIFSQNSLLKILEEPPKNIVFILIVPSKSSLLPTILSRLTIKWISSKKDRIQTNLNLSKLTTSDIYNFIKDKSRISKTESSELIESLILDAVTKYDFDFNEESFKFFDKIIRLNNLNSRPQTLLLSVLLEILKIKREKDASI